MKKLKFFVVSEIMGRHSMEDTHCLVPNFAGKRNTVFGGVFDGHGGSGVAVGLANNLAEFAKKAIESGADFKQALRIAHKKASESSWALKHHEGSCTAAFIVEGGTVTCANVGDCRIVVVGKSVRQLTRDHNIENRLEARRVRKHEGIINGGYIERGIGGIAVTRAVGDMFFWPIGLICAPFVSQSAIKSEDRFLVAASDGLFGDVSNREVLAASCQARSAEDLGEKLKGLVEQKEGYDNLTIIVVQLRQ